MSVLSCQAIALQGLADNDIFELTLISLANSEHGWMQKWLEGLNLTL